MKRIFLFFLSIIFSVTAIVAEPRVSVLTCSPGDEVYSLFGHTAFRYCDDERGMDVVFSYGYFDFEAPGFVWRFILGETDYMVGAVPYASFEREYALRGSEVVEQVLALSAEQKQGIFETLVENCKVENREYRYNYFYNNCTTRIRDLVFGYAVDVVVNDTAPAITFRQALSELTSAYPWYEFGINLILGSDIDKPVSREALEFIPGNLMRDLAVANARTLDGKMAPLVIKQSSIISPTVSSLPEQRSNLTPFNVSLLLLLFTMVVMLCEVRSRRTYWLYDILLMLSQGLAGLLLLFMALFSQHPAVGNNWLILLFNPLALVILPLLVYSIRKHKKPVVAWLQVCFVVAFLITAVMQLQVYPSPVYFCAMALLARSLFHIYKERICELSLY